jgi:hypothetical protein
MRVMRLVFFVAFALSAAYCQSGSAAGSAIDQAAAERVLGPHWQQLSRRAGIIFAGTVVGGEMQSPRTDRPVPSAALQFRVDHAITGVASGQTLTIHEWVGAQSLHPPMHLGEHFLLFLYPPSRLGLTSPVGGALGQIHLDASGGYVAAANSTAVLNATQNAHPASQASRAQANGPHANPPVPVNQLERAIRSARGD